MRNITVLDKWIPVVNGRSEGLNSIIRCVKIREMGFLVTPVEKDMTGGRKETKVY